MDGGMRVPHGCPSMVWHGELPEYDRTGVVVC
jgi:hypothetical protein